VQRRLRLSVMYHTSLSPSRAKVQRRLFARHAQQLEQPAQERRDRHVKTFDKAVHTLREAKTLASEKRWLAMLWSGKYTTGADDADDSDVAWADGAYQHRQETRSRVDA
jgi:hypothetical protein